MITRVPAARPRRGPHRVRDRRLARRRRRPRRAQPDHRRRRDRQGRRRAALAVRRRRHRAARRRGRDDRRRRAAVLVRHGRAGAGSDVAPRPSARPRPPRRPTPPPRPCRRRSDAGGRARRDAAPGPNLVGYGAAAESGPEAARPRAALPTRATGRPTAARRDRAAARSRRTTPPSPRSNRSPSDRARPRRCASSPAISASTSRPSRARGSAGSSPATTSRQRHRLGVVRARLGPLGVVGEPAESTRSADVGGPQRPPAETRIPIRGVRKHTAAAMVRSAFTAPHVTEFLTVDVTATMELLARHPRRPRVRRAQGHPARRRRQGAVHRRPRARPR